MNCVCVYVVNVINSTHARALTVRGNERHIPQSMEHKAVRKFDEFAFLFPLFWNSNLFPFHTHLLSCRSTLMCEATCAQFSPNAPIVSAPKYLYGLWNLAESPKLALFFPSISSLHGWNVRHEKSFFSNTRAVSKLHLIFHSSFSFHDACLASPVKCVFLILLCFAITITEEIKKWLRIFRSSINDAHHHCCLAVDCEVARCDVLENVLHFSMLPKLYLGKHFIRHDDAFTQCHRQKRC